MTSPDREQPAPIGSPHYTEYDTRLAAYAVIIDPAPFPGAHEPHLLLALWNEPEQSRWTLPGGGVDLAESAEQGVVREVREETGYDVELTDLLGIETDVFTEAQRARGIGAYGGRSLRAVRVFYTARVIGGSLAHEVGGSTDEARWWPLSRIGELRVVSMVETGLRYLENPPV